jgi:hypothetical protein
LRVPTADYRRVWLHVHVTLPVFAGRILTQECETAYPSPSVCRLYVHLQAKIVPESILQTCIKISNEPPSDMKSNMRSVSEAV